MYPENWKIEPFEKLARYETGRTPSRANPAYWNDPNGKPWVSIADMENYGVITTTKEKVSQLAFDQVFRDRISPAGTLIMSFKLTIGRVSTLGIDACHNEAIISIFPRSDISQDYLGYFLSQIDYAELQDRQVKGNTLNQDKINRIEIAVPPTAEQKHIASTLNLTRRAIDIQTRALENAQDLKRAAMLELFTKGLRGEPQKQTDIGLVPESWALVPAEQIFKLTSGKKRPDNLIPEPTTEKPFPVLGGNGVMGYSSEWFIEADTTLVIGRVGEYCGAVHLASGKTWITDNALYAKEWVNDEIDVRYVAEYLAYYDLNRFKRMAGQPLVTQGLINEHSFPMPSPAEQLEIASILDAIDRKIDLHKRKKAVLEELFKSLLHKLMTGEIRVSDLDLTAIQTGGN